MPTNTQVLNALQFSGPVPPDRECDIGNLTQILQGAVDFLVLATQTALIPGGGSGDSVAAQALQVANAALAAAQAAVAAQPATRNSTTPQALPTGDSAVPVVWAEPMPDTNYEVRVTYYGTATFPTQYFNWFVEDATRTVNGCTIRFNNTPANFKFSFVAQQLRTS